MKLDMDKFYVAYDYNSADCFLKEVVKNHSVYEQVISNLKKLERKEIESVAFRLCANGKISSSQDVSKYLDDGLEQVALHYVPQTSDTSYTWINMDDNVAPKIEIKENNKMNNRLVEMYEAKKVNKLEIELDKKLEEIKLEDPKYCAYIKIKEMAKNNNIEDIVEVIWKDALFDEKISKKLKEEVGIFFGKKQKIQRMSEEIVAQLEMCDTYEQKQQVLKNYKIINDKGIMR